MKVSIEFEVADDTQFMFATLDCMKKINGEWIMESYQKTTKDMVINASTTQEEKESKIKP